MLSNRKNFSNSLVPIFDQPVIAVGRLSDVTPTNIRDLKIKTIILCEVKQETATGKQKPCEKYAAAEKNARHMSVEILALPFAESPTTENLKAGILLLKKAVERGSTLLIADEPADFPVAVIAGFKMALDGIPSQIALANVASRFNLANSRIQVSLSNRQLLRAYWDTELCKLSDRTFSNGRSYRPNILGFSQRLP